jgi:hypothetical protein
MPKEFQGVVIRIPAGASVLIVGGELMKTGYCQIPGRTLRWKLARTQLS